MVSQALCLSSRPDAAILRVPCAQVHAWCGAREAQGALRAARVSEQGWPLRAFQCSPGRKPSHSTAVVSAVGAWKGQGCPFQIEQFSHPHLPCWGQFYPTGDKSWSLAFCAVDRPGDDHSLGSGERPQESGKHLEYHGTMLSSRAQKYHACVALTLNFSSALGPACTIPDIE